MTRARMLLIVLAGCGPDEHPAAREDLLPCGEAHTWFFDGDGDGHGDRSRFVRACTPPADHAPSAGDCDDADPAVHPGAAEACNGVDDDCDPATDEDVVLGTSWYLDGDGDGFGDPSDVVVACAPIPGRVAAGTDCDDADPAVNPGALDVCNGGVDDDCDPTTDEEVVDGLSWFPDLDHDGYGDPAGEVVACEAPARLIGNGDDCDDLDGFVHPGAEELCNGVDDDCDPATDEHATGETWYADTDGDGYGDAAAPFLHCGTPADGSQLDTDCDDADPTVHPDAVELCDGLDQDCDLVVDEEPGTLWYPDGDGDGFGDAHAPTASCTAVAGLIAVGGDCDDDDPLRHPGAPELCDTLDQDCDPVTPSDPCGSGCLWISNGGTYKTATGAKVDEHPDCPFDARGPDGLLYDAVGDTIDRYDGDDCTYLGPFATYEAPDLGDDPSYDMDAFFGRPLWDESGDLFAPWLHTFVSEVAVERFDGVSGAWIESTAPLFTLSYRAWGAPRGQIDGLGRIVLPVGDAIVRIDPVTGTVEELVPDLFDAIHLALGPDDTVFVLHGTTTDEVKRYDLRTGAWLGDVVTWVPAWPFWGAGSTGLIVSAECELLVTNAPRGEVDRYDAHSGAFLGSFPVDSTGPMDLGPCPDWFQMSLLPGADLLEGVPVTLEVVDATPGATVTFEYSEAGLGAGACPPDLGGLCSDLLSPVTLGAAVADASGVASLAWLVPDDLPVDEVALQAFAYGGAYPTKSNATVRDVVPPALPLDCEVEAIALVDGEAAATVQAGDPVTLSARLRSPWGPSAVELEDGCVPPVTFTGLPAGWDPWDGCAAPGCTGGSLLVDLDTVEVEVATVVADTAGTVCNGPMPLGIYEIGVEPSWLGGSPVTCGGATAELTVRVDAALADADTQLAPPYGLDALDVALPGDLDGDGFQDLLVGGAVARGRIVLGPLAGTLDLTTADVVVEGFAYTYEVSGPTVAGAGDVNGDGWPDVVFGDPGAVDGKGAVHLLEGPVAPGVLTVYADLHRIALGEPDLLLGSDLSGVGDVDGDGLDDVLLGGDGIALLVAGPAAASVNPSTAAATLLPEDPSDGTVQVAGPGDVDGDGLADLLLGAPAADPGGLDAAGSAYLLHGPVTGAVDLATSDAVLDGVVEKGRLGVDVGGAGDHDGDGLPDVWLGRSDSGGDGAVYLVPGRVAGVADVESVALATIVGTDDATFGAALADAGDMDGDGYRDVIVGARGDDTGAYLAGAAWVIYGPFAGTVPAVEVGVRYLGHDGVTWAGDSVAGGADMDGDGLPDALIGALRKDNVDTEPQAWLLLGGLRPW